MDKVTAYLQGGLGNQCFVYAMARALTLRTNKELCFDTRLFRMDKVYKRTLELHNFECKLPLTRQIGWLEGKAWNLMRLKAPRILDRLTRRIVETRSTKPNDLVVRGSICLDGYWQSEEYFKDYADLILDDFRLKDNGWVKNDPVAQQIAETENAIFLHIRSYMESPSMKDGSGALPVSYFKNALAYLASKLNTGHVFVFSDNLSWAKEKLDGIDRGGGKFKVSYVAPIDDGVVSSQIRDFTLMRFCKHGIVANSSFSWWAGWLGEREQLNRGESPIRIRVNSFVNNEHFWPERWIAVDE